MFSIHTCYASLTTCLSTWNPFTTTLLENTASYYIPLLLLLLLLHLLHTLLTYHIPILSTVVVLPHHHYCYRFKWLYLEQPKHNMYNAQKFNYLQSHAAQWHCSSSWLPRTRLWITLTSYSSCLLLHSFTLIYAHSHFTSIYTAVCHPYCCPIIVTIIQHDPIIYFRQLPSFQTMWTTTLYLCVEQYLISLLEG